MEILEIIFSFLTTFFNLDLDFKSAVCVGVVLKWIYTSLHTSLENLSAQNADTRSDYQASFQSKAMANFRTTRGFRQDCKDKFWSWKLGWALYFIPVPVKVLSIECPSTCDLDLEKTKKEKKYIWIRVFGIVPTRLKNPYFGIQETKNPKQ